MTRLPLAFALAGVVVACGTRLTALDTRALQNQSKACEAIWRRTDAGPVKSLSEACVCNGDGVLRRAGEGVPDAGGVLCP